jgi:hypothetical protein
MALTGAMLFASLMMATRTSRGKRLVLPASLGVVALMVVSWVGIERIATRFVSRPLIDADGRYAIWTDAWRIVQDFWLTGTGLNTFGVSALFYQASLRGSHMREAHNDYLQLLAEGGVLLAIPILMAIAAAAFVIQRRLREDVGSIWCIRMGAVTALLAIAAQSLVEFSLQMPANAALFCVICGIAMHDGAPVAQGSTRDATAPNNLEPDPQPPQPNKVIKFGRVERQLDIAFGEAMSGADASRRAFLPSALDEPRVARARRGTAGHQAPPSQAGRRLDDGHTIILVAVLSLLGFLLLAFGFLDGCVDQAAGNRLTTTAATTMMAWE